MVYEIPYDEKYRVAYETKSLKETKMYNQNKVEWSEAEHEAAQAADQMYETLAEAFKDGAQISDIAVLPALLQPGNKLYAYLATDNKMEFANKLIGLGVMIIRDNEMLQQDKEPDSA